MPLDSKPRADSKLKTLPADRQDAILEYLREHTLDQTVAWLDQDGIKTSRNAVHLFRGWYVLQRNYSDAQAGAQDLAEMLRHKLPEISAPDLEEYARQAFEIIALKKQDPELWLSLKTAQHNAQVDERTLVIKERELELKERRLKLLEEKEAAAKGVLGDQELTDAEKQARMKEIFGIS